MNRNYLDTARLLMQVAPFVFADGLFALKGGTAINLFVRDMPRLSVDIDLVFTDHTLSRTDALEGISKSIKTSAEHLPQRGFQPHIAGTADGDTKLMVRRDSIEIKVEVNYVMRGTVYPVRMASLMPAAREILSAELEIPVVSLEDVYGSKLVAALDRQHPRDLFDVMQLFAHEGLTPGIRRAFAVYLACHNRPVHEVLNPSLRDIRLDYERNFNGMTTEPIPLTALLETRERMVAELQHGMTSDERSFLISLVSNRPEWNLLGLDHLETLPALQWKHQNLKKLQDENQIKFEEQAEILISLLAEEH